jgi:arylsulfate sulfotransferase
MPFPPFKRSLLIRTAVTMFLALTAQSVSAASIVTITGQTPGPTPFISKINATVTNAANLDHVDFKVYPKAGSVTRPVFARYSSTYLQSRGYLNLGTGKLTVPAFGLYANYNNSVGLVFFFSDQTYQRFTVPVQTPVWNDSVNVYLNPTVVQARLTTTALSYDFSLLKNFASSNTPIIIDTDAQVRWVGTAGLATQSAILFNNGIYISNGGSGIIRMELDGAYRTVADYSSLGVTYTGHHNFDYGKSGMLLDVNTTAYTECVDLEVDASGNVLKTWNLAQIISAAMTAGGDDPTQFVQGAPTDWFHNNATTYRPSDDSLIVSSRENFVICLDYSTGAIKWILGDPTKKWYQFPSLRQYALTTGPNTIAPIGQHAVSVYRDRLLLFDDGANSQYQSPAGASRSYSSPRKYQIDTAGKVATEIWNYPAGQALYSGFCSSVYEDRSQNYLITYSQITAVMGLDPTGTKVFDYRYPTLSFCGTSWNSVPIHLENLRFN